MKKNLKEIEAPKLPPVEVPLPWQTSQWQQLCSLFEGGSMPHAQILCGAQGLGKQEFAFALGLFMFCTAKVADKACRSCRNCHLIQTQVHPDFLRIAPEKPGSAIKIDDIRALDEFTNRTSESAIAKVVVIENAESMNRNAANALLKSLEEPPAGTYFLLVTSREMQLPITVRSRCQLVRFITPHQSVGLKWLESRTDARENWELPMLLAADAPLAAELLMLPTSRSKYSSFFAAFEALSCGRSNVVHEAKGLSDLELPQLLTWVSSWIANLVRAINIPDEKAMKIGYPALEASTQALPMVDLLQFQGAVQRAFSDSRAVSNINKQLILEDLLMNWQRITR
ncbi:MAG: DNA polymerase III subunit delta' [Pseudomonadales bacterium]|nr:DNA polymerase III subunit delta' [Pseudomonadales bacterium]